LEPVDLENLRIRVFTEVFPDDPMVHVYQVGTTLENRFNLLIHIAAMEAGVTVSDYMDLHGITMDYLCGELKKAIEGGDKQTSARFLGLAFNLKVPPKVTVKKAEQNIFNFGSKAEGVRRVEEQIREIGAEAKQVVEELLEGLGGGDGADEEAGEAPEGDAGRTVLADGAEAVPD